MTSRVSDLSILEISHRSPEFVAVLEEAERLARELYWICPMSTPSSFLTGGASSEFYLTAMNLLNEGETAGYVDTGAWSAKAIKEAGLFGGTNVLASSKDKNYTYIPKGYDIPTGLKYVHLTSNNTIFGTQFKDWPETDALPSWRICPPISSVVACPSRSSVSSTRVHRRIWAPPA